MELPMQCVNAHTSGPQHLLVLSRPYGTSILTSRSVATRTLLSEKNCCKSIKRWRVFKLVVSNQLLVIVVAVYYYYY